MKLKTKFQDEDFELGEVEDVVIATMPDGSIKVQSIAERGGLHTFFYKTKAEFDANWEDAPEEPKEYWFIDEEGDISSFDYAGDDYDKKMQAIGNCFKTEEQAKKTVKKLMAWKRLKDKGFKVDLWDYDGSDGQGRIRTGKILFRVKDYEENDEDLDLLFGGEE